MKAFFDRPLFTGSACIVALLICLIVDRPALVARLWCGRQVSPS
ncbi:hypothetical protein [Methylomonas sp. 11b]|nr:hypothetical protein [Methylomonas sp. 11b]